VKIQEFFINISYIEWLADTV